MSKTIPQLPPYTNIHLLIFSTILFSLMACSPSIGSENIDRPITITIPIPKESFSQEAIIRVRLYNEEQVKISNAQAHCMVIYNIETEKSTRTCPEGVEYQEVTPETFEFSIQEIDDSIEIQSQKLELGSTFEVGITGTSKDDCNTTRAHVQETVNGAIVTLDNLPWNSTLVACLDEPYPNDEDE